MNPTDTTLLFERFISRERNEAPDIDVDFEHERREEVIQYLYDKYGLQRTALAAAVASYRTRGAVRDIGQALGHGRAAHRCGGQVVSMVRRSTPICINVWPSTASMQTAPVTRRWLELVATLHGFPRHLSQHSGGFVIARDKLSRMVPIENAAMKIPAQWSERLHGDRPESERWWRSALRRVIQWDKDDLESLGLLKVDVLALGMLTALRRSLDFINAWHHRRWELHDIPREDKATYDMICRADTVGVFQIESRAQMSMLPRLQPRKLYDLVIEVAIVRPGPIQGGMVHPYLKRRQGLEPSGSPKPELDAALERTLGVPIFQEQVMQICMIAAGFTADEADLLRRAMAAWRRSGNIGQYGQKIIHGMKAKGYEACLRAGHLRTDQRVQRLRLPRKPRLQLRAARLREQLDQMPRAGDLPRRDAQFAADGFLRPVATGAGRAASWRRGAAGRRLAQRLGLHARAPRRAAASKRTSPRRIDRHLRRSRRRRAKP